MPKSIPIPLFDGRVVLSSTSIPTEIIVIGNPLILSPDFPPLQTVREIFQLHTAFHPICFYLFVTSLELLPFTLSLSFRRVKTRLTTHSV